jgi:diguanylate cyclase (GGDEF)-like protein/PAS domain S-box-containing protein
MRAFYGVWLTLCLLISLNSLNAKALSYEVSVDIGSSSILLQQDIQWLVADSSTQLSDIQNLHDWQNAVPLSALDTNQSLWGTINLRFSRTLTEFYYLQVSNPQLDYVDIYLLDDKDRILSSHLMGNRRAAASPYFNPRLFIAPVDSQDQQVKVFFKISDDGPLVFSISMQKQQTLIANEQILLTIMGFICGGLTLLAGYFLITYVYMRSPVRFWFSLSTAILVVLLLNYKGLFGQITGLLAYISNINIALLGLLLLSTTKVSLILLEGIPARWRYIFYLLAYAMLAMAFTANSSQHMLFATACWALVILLILVLGLFYLKPDKKQATLFYFCGLNVIAISGATQVSLLFLVLPISELTSMLLAAMILLGTVLIALAIEAHERMLKRRQYLQQQNVIGELQHYYQFFKDGAEGFYTSTLEGKLTSVNQAMCDLFGYANEGQMLQQVVHTEQLYAQPKDRELLLGDIHQNGAIVDKELKGKRQDGTEFWFSISGQIKNQGNNEQLFGGAFDITQRKQSSISLHYLATHDPLTGVYNRLEFERQLRAALLNAQHSNSDLTLLYMNLDQFKVVNDSCGHKAGDLLIKQLSQELNTVVMEKGVLARLNGDEFAVLLEADNAQMAYLLANKILSAVQAFRFVWEGRVFTLGISIGQVSWQANISAPEQLLSMADAACFRAKEKGRNQVHTYSSEDIQMQRYASELSWLDDIKLALKDDSFELYYQHYQALGKSAGGHHYEILLRMRGQESTIIAPNAFLPSAERYNFTTQIDRWVVENYFSWLKCNPEHEKQLERVSINLNGHSFADQDLKLFVLNAFKKYQIPYHKVCFEITESMAMLKMDETLEFIHTFRALGCLFALDDFGSGFSSYNYLKNMPVDQVKIDGTFIKDILVDPIDMAMVGSIKDIAKAMGMETVAEFVESPEIMVELGKMGIDYAQGFGIAKPKPLANFESHH